MISSPDVSNVSIVISSFGVIVEKCCTESDVTCNVIFTMRLYEMYTWMYRYRCKSPNEP